MQGGRGGRPEGPPRAPVLCLHGYPGSGDHWLGLAAALGPGRRLRAPDMAWIAGSALADDWPVPTLAGLFPGIADMIAAEGRPCHLVGHDLGGAIGWWLATLAPELVLSLTVLAAPHPTEYRDAVARLEAEGRRDYIKRMLEGPQAAPLPTISLAATGPEAHARVIAAQARTDPARLRGLYRTSLSDRALAAAPELPPTACPVLVVAGGADAYLPPYLFERPPKALGPRVQRHLLDGAGHFLTLTHADELAPLLSSHWEAPEAAAAP